MTQKREWSSIPVIAFNHVPIVEHDLAHDVDLPQLHRP